MAGQKRENVNIVVDDPIDHFMSEWGRVVIPLFIILVLGGLRLFGVLNDQSLGFAVGLVLILAMPLAIAFILWRGTFPRWTTWASLVFLVLYLGSAIWPFTTMVYPGPAVFDKSLKWQETTPLEGVDKGCYFLYISAESFRKLIGTGRGDGSYRVQLGGQTFDGRFFDSNKQIQSKGNSGGDSNRNVTDLYIVKLDEVGSVNVKRLDKQIGPDLHISLHPIPIRPIAVGGILFLILLYTAILDGLFQEQTYRWRFAPWIGVSASFLAIFFASYEPSKMPGTAIWSAAFGTLGGFFAGWIFSLIVRKIIGTVRTRM